MTPGTPVACSLSRDELPARLAEMRAVGKDALLGVSSEGALRFRADANTRARLDAIIAAESRCCAFLRCEFAEAGGELVVSVTAPDGAEPLARDLVDAFAAEAEVA